jgi:hypothetical protein
MMTPDYVRYHNDVIASIIISGSLSIWSTSSNGRRCTTRLRLYHDDSQAMNDDDDDGDDAGDEVGDND